MSEPTFADCGGLGAEGASSWIILDPFCSMQFMNNVQHLPGDATPEAERVLQV